ncbi:MAG: GNAT family N-acetyltransferase [Prochloraceae cyanobacterium]|nr:GNAT family N-acetyltransferase [Prochloraceae cyanobacterium]
MVFWKRLFSSSDAIETSTESSVFEGDLLGEIIDPKIGSLNSEGNNVSRIYFSKRREIDLYELEELCDSVGWARRPLRKVKKALQYSFLVVSMWEVKGKKQRLIGFARATSDCAFNATIWDVVVHPAFQKKGLGKALMKYTIDSLRKQDISNITLFADPQVIDFYRNLGFILEPEGIKGMFWYPD